MTKADRPRRHDRQQAARPPVAQARPWLTWLLVAAALGLLYLASSFALDRYLVPFFGEYPAFKGPASALVTLLYALLLAIPFVPGAEIGISLLMKFGSDVAVVVYGATLAGLTLAYGFGLAFGDRLACDFLWKIGLRRACRFVDDMKVLSPAERLERLENSLPTWLGRYAIRSRYLLLAILINLPGNSLIGGGGGILLVAGLTRVFRPLPTLATLALATLPVPALVYVFGAGWFG